ncbi:MAG: helix-turn-helix transcriptional regulator [Candidatus Sumerlaeota bacterium]|nr:helix-turn-helix transcriptional regulator [Candidatus Sumerlaeota bacterium]
MAKIIAQRLMRHRKKLKLTQDEFGQQYKISGPAVFKFEKGYVTPSLELWLKMAKAMGIPVKTAVLMHVHDKLPEAQKQLTGIAALIEGEGESHLGKDDFRKFKKKDDLRQAIANHQLLPDGLREFAASQEMWTMYRPTGEEVNILRDAFGPLGEGKARDFCDGLRLIREFRGTGV